MGVTRTASGVVVGGLSLQGKSLCLVEEGQRTMRSRGFRVAHNTPLRHSGTPLERLPQRAKQLQAIAVSFWQHLNMTAYLTEDRDKAPSEKSFCGSHLGLVFI
jgi:hypothetical protein